MPCDTCKYFDSEAGNSRSKIGQCRRYPPHGDTWALVGPQDWCGQYTPAASEDGPVEGQVPDQVQQQAFSLYGYMPPELAEWCDHYPEDWVIQAIARTGERHKQKPSYTSGILRNWWKQGGVDKGGEAKDYTPPEEQPDDEQYGTEEWARLTPEEREQATEQQNPYKGKEY